MATSKAKRIWFGVLGVFFVVLAGVGVALPGIPTVGPLLLGSFFLTKSSPALEKRLIRNKFFARYLPYLDGSESMTTKARITSICLMWLSIGLSTGILYASNKAPVWLIVTLLVAGLIGTVFIWRFGKKRDGVSPSKEK